MTSEEFEALKFQRPFNAEEMRNRSHDNLLHAQKRRTVRDFSSDDVDDVVIENCLRTAMTAPSGANQQPWTFAWVKSQQTRKQLREAAEEEERAFYGGRAPDEWLDAVAPFGTDADKPFLEKAPVLIAIFAESWKLVDGEQKKNYYVNESVGIATGMLISALHHAGLATLTHTPSPMKFLNKILQRPQNERPYLVLVAGHPTQDCKVPVITKRTYEDVVVEA